MVIFSLFLPIKSSTLALKAPKLFRRCRLWIESQITKKSRRWKILSKLGKFWQKMPFMRLIQNLTLWYNSSYSEARVLKFGKGMQKKVQKNHRKPNFEFYPCQSVHLWFVFKYLWEWERPFIVSMGGLDFSIFC